MDNLFFDGELSAPKSSSRNGIFSTRNCFLTDEDLALGACVEGAEREVAIALDHAQSGVRDEGLELGREEFAL